MQLRRLSTSILPALALALAAGATPAAAQGRQLFEWSGRVDREVQITMRGRDAYVADGRYGNSNGRLRTENVLPRENGTVIVRVEGGRGDAYVVQQPSRRNDYTTIVRVRDAARGNGRVRVQAYWRDDDRLRDVRDDRGRRDDGAWGRGADDRYGRTAMRWSGEVDGAVEIRIRGGRVDYRTLNGSPLRNVRADDFRGFPAGEADVSVDARSGRGSVYVAEQPSARNGYTTVIRIDDPRPGADYYAFDLTVRDRALRRW